MWNRMNILFKAPTTHSLLRAFTLSFHSNIPTKLKVKAFEVVTVKKDKKDVKNTLTPKSTMARMDGPQCRQWDNTAGLQATTHRAQRQHKRQQAKQIHQPQPTTNSK